MVVIDAPNYELSKYIVLERQVHLECKNYAFEIQFKPFYTKPIVLRARAVLNIMSLAEFRHQRRY
jgi:hypothetical protein